MPRGLWVRFPPCVPEFLVSLKNKWYIVLLIEISMQEISVSYHNTYLQNKRKARKQQLVDNRGGGCERCGYNRCLEALEFHHRDPSTKRFLVNGSVLAAKRWEVILEEAAKCDILCANCHREITYGSLAKRVSHLPFKQ